MPAPGDAVLERMVGFGRVLRGAGLEVGPGRLQDALRGLDVVGLTRRDDVFHALRCTLVALGESELEGGVVDATLGSVLKHHEDIELVRDGNLSRLVAHAREA